MQKAFWAFFLAMTLGICKAQVSIYIEDQTQSEFKLVANGYLQNVISAKALIFEGYSPKSKYDFVFLLSQGNQPLFRRKMELPQPGLYHFVIVQNFTGSYQLRLRGKLNELPPNVKKINYQQQIAYAPALSRLAKSKNTQLASSNRIGSQLPKQNSPKEEPIVVVEALNSSHSKNTELTEDSVPAKKQSLKTALIEFQAIDFEFEKLQYAQGQLLLNFDLNAELAVQVLESFKYDQTRLQFLEQLLDYKPSLRFSGDLFLETLAYELSQGQARELLKKAHEN